MAEQRKDSKGRNLRPGESQRKDGRYVYQWVDARGKRNTVYSWTLNPSDRPPKGKKNDRSLRVMEDEIARDMQKGLVTDCRTTLDDLIQQYLALRKPMVAQGTYHNYLAFQRRVNKLGWNKLKARRITTSTAKQMIQQVIDNGGTVIIAHQMKSFLSGVFQTAVEDDIPVKNPFSYKWNIKKDLKRREGMTPQEQSSLLSFTSSSDFLYQRYHNKIVFLLNTGLRVSEFCGLTLDDIDLENRMLRVNKQLGFVAYSGYFVSHPKTDTGRRIIPLNNDALSAVQWLIRNRDTKGKNFSVDGYSDFLILNNSGNGTIRSAVNRQFRTLSDRYNRVHSNKLRLTPHILRHTFCSNCFRKGMNPKAVQMLMGHASYSTTINVYTHISYEEIAREFLRD